MSFFCLQPIQTPPISEGFFIFDFREVIIHCASSGFSWFDTTLEGRKGFVPLAFEVVDKKKRNPQLVTPLTIHFIRLTPDGTHFLTLSKEYNVLSVHEVGIHQNSPVSIHISEPVIDGFFGQITHEQDYLDLIVICHRSLRIYRYSKSSRTLSLYTKTEVHSIRAAWILKESAPFLVCAGSHLIQPVEVQKSKFVQHAVFDVSHGEPLSTGVVDILGLKGSTWCAHLGENISLRNFMVHKSPDHDVVLQIPHRDMKETPRLLVIQDFVVVLCPLSQVVHVYDLHLGLLLTLPYEPFWDSCVGQMCVMDNKIYGLSIDTLGLLQSDKLDAYQKLMILGTRPISERLVVENFRLLLEDPDVDYHKYTSLWTTYCLGAWKASQGMSPRSGLSPDQFLTQVFEPQFFEVLGLPREAPQHDALVFASLAYYRSLVSYSLPVSPEFQAFLVYLLLAEEEFEEVVHLLQYRIFPDSLDLLRQLKAAVPQLPLEICQKWVHSLVDMGLRLQNFQVVLELLIFQSKYYEASRLLIRECPNWLDMERALEPLALDAQASAEIRRLVGFSED